MPMSGGMPMPGGWTMSMMWMRTPGQTWPGAVFMFVVMWSVMMVAMMLPSVAPVLWRYYATAARAGRRRSLRLTAIAAAGYGSAWALPGLIVYPAGAALAALEMREPALSEAVPLLAGLIVASAGVLQLTPWKAHHLACCRDGRSVAGETGSAGGAWRYGLRLGGHCLRACSGLTAILLVAGVMDRRTMTAVTAAVTVERLAPGGGRAARAIGGLIVVGGVDLVFRALSARVG
jgi:predicted metal-binding membrane protein